MNGSMDCPPNLDRSLLLLDFGAFLFPLHITLRNVQLQCKDSQTESYVGANAVSLFKRGKRHRVLFRLVPASVTDLNG